MKNNETVSLYRLSKLATVDRSVPVLHKMKINTASCLVSQDVLRKCDRNDRSDLLELCKRSLQNVDSEKSLLNSPSNINAVIYEVCWHTMYGKLSVDSAVSALAEIAAMRSDLPSVIADVLVVLDTESLVYDSQSLRDRYLNLLRTASGLIVPESTMKERLEFETMGDAGIIKACQATSTKFIKIKTRLFYKQQKFNLYREVAEGFAKLITELHPDNVDHANVEYGIEVIRSLIGCFNLDPNRVLDVILESFEYRPDLFSFFTSLLRSFHCTSEALSQIIGFKFGFYKNGSEETSSSLFRVTALLLKSGLLSLDQIYSLLTPSDSQIDEKMQQDFADAQAFAKQLNSLASSATDGKQDSQKPQNKEVVNQTEEDNQKLGLLSALLDVGDWENARDLIFCFPVLYAVSHLHIAHKLCTLIHVVIDKLYKKQRFQQVCKRSTKYNLESALKVKEVETFEELFSDVYPMILHLGPYLHVDPILMAQIIRLSTRWLQMKSRDSEEATKAIRNVIDESLLPSLSLMSCNCCISEELWHLLKLFPYQVRYYSYGRWKEFSNLQFPILIRTKAEALKKLKYIMKRLSKENVKPTGRQIGKLSHSNPSYLFDFILNQIQVWDNLIVPVVDSLKYLTPLSYDVLAYCIIEALANPEKDRMKHDGASISLWLQSLAHFSGAVFKKYSIDIAGLLQYVASKLKSGNSIDLLILKEVVQKMAGIEATEEMTPEQVEAMTGGDLLRTEGGYFNQLRNVKKSSQRLKEALMSQGLAIPLCLLIAQQRQCVVYHEQEHSHLKLVGKLYDQCQDTLVQFGSFLSGSLNMDDYISRVPLVSALLMEYCITADVAFFLIRPTLNHAINSKMEEVRRQDKSLKTSSSSHDRYLACVHAVMDPIQRSIVSAEYPRKNWDDLSPQFYVTFWSLTVYDLSVPSASYEREILKLKTASQSEESKDAASKKKKEKERCDALIAKLQEEEKAQREHCARIMVRLKSEKDHWFQSKAAKNETITQFLQLCVFPRCIFTPVDALYCAKFVHFVHCLKTPNFSTLLCYDRVFCDITYTVALCTEYEANRYGLFLRAMLETVMRWHSDRSIFDKECANFPGFMTKFKVSTQNANSAVDHVDYENYRHICHKWHYKIAKGLLKCLESGDFVQIRNSLLVLIKISAHFPILINMSQVLERRIEKIKTEEKEKRPDIFTLATGYSGILKAKKSGLVQESDFHLKEANRQNNVVNQAKIEKKENDASANKSETQKSIKTESKEAKAVTSVNKNITTEKQNSVVVNSQPSSNTRTRSSHKEVEFNGIDVRPKSTSKTKEERSVESTGSPMRRGEEKTISSRTTETSERNKDDKRDRREEHHEKSSRSGSTAPDSAEAHVHRREDSDENATREHKRRRTDLPASKSPRDSDRDKSSSSRDDEKSHKEAVEPTSEKAKSKKSSRKRDHVDDGTASDGPRRRRQKTEEELEKTRKDEKSPIVYSRGSSQDRRSDREDKKHHRSSSSQGTNAKKRS